MRRKDTSGREPAKGKGKDRGSDREKDPDLRNVMGDLMISQFQAERIRTKLAGKVEGYRHAAAGYYYQEDAEKSSFCQFQHKGRLYRISIKVDRMPSLKRNRLEQFVGSLDPEAILGFWKEK